MTAKSKTQRIIDDITESRIRSVRARIALNRTRAQRLLPAEEPE